MIPVNEEVTLASVGKPMSFLQLVGKECLAVVTLVHLARQCVHYVRVLKVNLLGLRQLAEVCLT